MLQLSARLARSAQVNMDELKEDEKAWIDVLNRFRLLQSSEKTMNELRVRIFPPLEEQVSEEAAQLEKVQEEVEEVRGHKSDCKLIKIGKATGPACQDRSKGSADAQELRCSRLPESRRDQ